MYVACFDEELHWDSMDPCEDCGTIICSLCNDGLRCANGCGPEPVVLEMDEEPPELRNLKRPRSWSDSSNHDPVLPLQRFRVIAKRRRRVLLFEEEETMSYDTLRPGPSGVPFYAKIVDIERQWRGSTLVAHHLILEALHAAWFDALAEDLSDLPEYSRWPTWAGRCKLDMVLDTPVYETLLAHLDELEVELEEGLWLQLGVGLHGGESYVNGIPVRIFLPPQAQTELGLVDLSGRYTDKHVILSVDAIASDSLVGQKLDRLSHRIF